MSVRRKLQKVYDRKAKRVQELKKLKYNLLLIAYSGIVERKEYKDIQKRLFKETINFEQAKRLKVKRLYRTCWKIVKQIKRKTDFILLPINRHNEVSRLLIENKNLNLLDKEINEIVRTKETEEKEEIIKEALSEDKPFILVSWHKDSANDHIDWQGKIYVNEDFLNEPKVKEIAEQRKMQTFQWLIGEPVYMITRPNCRHYFQPLSVKEVEDNSVQSLLKKYGMVHKVGQRGLFQTLADKNRKALVQKYKERLALLEGLKKIQPTLKLEQAIKKTKLLIKKWNY